MNLICYCEQGVCDVCGKESQDLAAVVQDKGHWAICQGCLNTMVFVSQCPDQVPVRFYGSPNRPDRV